MREVHDRQISQGVLDHFWTWSMQSGLENSYECVKPSSASDFIDDLERFDSRRC